MTPWQSSALLEVEGDMQRDRFDLALFNAWHVEAFARTKKLPELAKLLKRTARKERAPDLDAKLKAVLSMFPRKPRTENA